LRFTPILTGQLAIGAWEKSKFPSRIKIEGIGICNNLFIRALHLTLTHLLQFKKLSI
jgi:hypothetical protein